MWREYLNHEIGHRWMSTNFKGALLRYPSYSKINYLWGRARLENIESELVKKGEKILHLNGGIEETLEDGKLIFAGPPEWIVKEVCEGLKTYRNYAKNQIEVKQLIAEWYRNEYNLEIDPSSEIALVPGASFGVDSCVRIIAGPGDEVLIMDPDYVTYRAQVASIGAKPVPVPLKENNGEWEFNIEELEKRISPMTKLLMMSNANNPSGFLYTKEDLQHIAELAQRYDFMVLHDQVAEEFILDSDEGYRLTCLASLQNMKERTIVTSSFSKMYNIGFWRAGWVVANKHICEMVLRVMWWVTDGPVTPGIDAALAILKNRKERKKYVSKKLATLKRNRDYMKKRLGEMGGVVPNTPRGHYWAWPNVSAFGMTSQELAEYLLKEWKLSVRPGTWYGANGEGHFRLSFYIPLDYMEKALDRMKEGLGKLLDEPITKIPKRDKVPEG